MIEELKSKSKLILFIDEIHTLMGNKNESLDFANMFKPALDRGDIKVIGATTSEEYERFILRDKAFVRRFQKIQIDEPTRNENIRILLGTLPKIEKRTGAKMMYTDFKKRQMMEFLTDRSGQTPPAQLHWRNFWIHGRLLRCISPARTAGVSVRIPPEISFGYRR